MSPRIPIVYDTKNNENILAELIDELYEQHELQDVRTNNIKSKRFLCAYCMQLVHLFAREDKTARLGHHYHFQHPKGIDCEWKSDSKSKAQIYAGIQEGKKHREMKHLLAETLTDLDEWEVVDVDSKFVFSTDKLQRARPDLHARFNGSDVAFEIQLRSESPEVIERRQKFYFAKGWKLIWLSADNSEIVSDYFELDCAEVKQVQKDIAFSNRGNWFIFNKKLSKRSIQNKKLTILVKIWEPKVKRHKIYYGWKEKLIHYDDLQFSDGNTFYEDFYQLNQQLQITLHDEGKARVLKDLSSWKVKNWSDFLLKSKRVWPSLDLEIDNDWLHAQFTKDMQMRELKVKGQIIAFFRSSAWREEKDSHFWNKLASRVTDLDFGIKADSDLRVIEKLLLILGYDLSCKLNRENFSHAQATHYFFDYESFREYLSLCMLTVEKSPYRNEILNNKNVVKRLGEPPVHTTQSEDLNQFVEWFTTEPSPTKRLLQVTL